MTDILIVEGRIGAVKPVRIAIVRGTEAWLWIDAGIAGTPREFVFPELHRLGLTPPTRNLLVVTHCDVDHFGGAAELQAALPGLVVVAHHADADLIANLDRLVSARYDRFRHDGLNVPEARLAQLRTRAGSGVTAHVLVDGPMSVDIGGAGSWELVEVPGHSAGHLAVVASDRSVAFAGDAVMGWGVRDGDGNLQPPHYVDVAAYVGSIATLERMSIGILQLSHEEPLAGDALVEFFADSRRAVIEIGAAVDRAVDAAAGAGINSAGRLRRICEAVHRELGRWPDAPATALADAVMAHLAVRSRRLVTA